MSRALVTGGTGFIGAEVVKRLAERGDSVVAFDLTPDEARLDGVTAEIEQGDLSDEGVVGAVIATAKPDTIYHFGGMLSVPSEADPGASFRVNAGGTFNVLEAARSYGVKQVFFASTMVTFGMDTVGQTIGDDTLQRPSLFYGATKVFSEHVGLWFKRRHGLDFRGIRFPGIVGPGVKTSGVAQYNAWMIEAAINGEPFSVWVKPETRHAILYYKDAAAATIQLADATADRLKRSVYVVTSEKPSPSAGELADAVKRQIPEAKITFEPDPERQKVLDDVERPIDDSNAREEWGFAPEYGLDEMVKDFIDTSMHQ